MRLLKRINSNDWLFIRMIIMIVLIIIGLAMEGCAAKIANERDILTAQKEITIKSKKYLFEYHKGWGNTSHLMYVHDKPKVIEPSQADPPSKQDDDIFSNDENNF